MQSEHNSDRWIRRAFEAKSKELRAKIFPDSISKHVAFLLFTRQHGKNLLGHCKEVSVFLAPLRHSSPSGLTKRTLFPTLVERGLCPDFFFLFCVRKSPVLFYSKHNIWKRFVRIIVVWSKKRTLYQTELITSMAFYFTRNPVPRPHHVDTALRVSQRDDAMITYSKSISYPTPPGHRGESRHLATHELLGGSEADRPGAGWVSTPTARLTHPQYLPTKEGKSLPKFKISTKYPLEECLCR